MLPFGRLWYGEPNAVSNAIGYAKFRSRSHNAVIPVFDEAGNVIAPFTNGFPLLPSTDQLMDQASAETCVTCLRKAVRYPDIAVSTSGKI